MLLQGKQLVITGVLTTDSIAFAAAKSAMDHGAEIILTNTPRTMSLMGRVAARLPRQPVAQIPLDVTDTDQIATLTERVGEHWEHVDGLLHAIAFAPQTALGGNFLTAPWPDVATAMHVSAYSLKALATGLLPLLDKSADGASIVSLDFDASVAWPIYDWMGPAKAALESVSRYLARDLGPHRIRVNTVSAGPLTTMAGKGIPGFSDLAHAWPSRAPLGWDTADPSPVGDTITFLFSNLARAITGTVLYVDGGYRAVGAPIRE